VTDLSDSYSIALANSLVHFHFGKKEAFWYNEHTIKLRQIVLCAIVFIAFIWMPTIWEPIKAFLLIFRTIAFEPSLVKSRWLSLWPHVFNFSALDFTRNWRKSKKRWNVIQCSSSSMKVIQRSLICVQMRVSNGCRYLLLTYHQIAAMKRTGRENNFL
jgi:hypothetical protein